MPTITDWIQAGASVVAMVVASVALLIAFDARRSEERQARVAARAEAMTKRDARVRYVSPILANEPETGYADTGVVAGHHVAKLTLPAPWNSPALDVRVRIRGLGKGAAVEAVTAEVGAIGPGETGTATLILTPFVKRQMGPYRTWAEVYELDVEYHGQLGQRIVEHYLWRLEDSIHDREVPFRWRLSRFEIDTAVEGADVLDLEFGEPAYGPPITSWLPFEDVATDSTKVVESEGPGGPTTAAEPPGGPDQSFDARES